MTDQNAPVTKHYRSAREHLEGVKARAKAIQALHAFWQAEHSQHAAQRPADPPPEETP
ncbi:MAG TPA: hypothetical protein VGG07_25140 [Solirubrobacteraceae bacterium]|jgi:hypothetical protein